ncbi:MAG: helix-turn-helix domain-containing protein [Magnetovibrio sp.]|nr:helix-turn-helix domain-containing protein [Magnetovibrio sp.]
MTAAVDSAATMASQAECEADEDGPKSHDGGISGHFPVFAAFDDLGLTGRDVAELASVTPPTVSKWRKAKVQIPGEKIAFLALVLAHLLDEAEANVDALDMDKGVLMSARAALLYQDVLNRDLHPADVREGAQRFRTWWTSGAATKLQQKRFQPRDSAELLETLKRAKAKSA